jgi:hypothetical protein
MLGQNVDAVKKMESDIQSFRRTKKEAIFTWYVGVVNHWVGIIVHKTKEEPKKLNFYLLDSSNLHFLEKVDL